MKIYKNYLFDLDGTLLETEKLILECFKYSLKTIFDVNIPNEDLLNKIGLPLKEQFILLTKEYNLRAYAYEEVQKIHMGYQMEIWQDYVKLLPRVEELLGILKKKDRKLAIVTSRKINTASLYLKYTKIFDFFISIITPESTLLHKPEAEPALKAMEELGAHREETLFVGDSIFDMECAKKSGIDAYLVLWNKKNRLNITPQYIENNFSRIIDSFN